MPLVTLPDNSIKNIEDGMTAFDVAASIGKSLASSALAAVVDGRAVDLDFTIRKDCKLEIITQDSRTGLEILRHDAAHILAQAIKELYPSAYFGVGPVIEDGFYYDISCDKTISSSDLEEIEKKMRQICEKNYPITRREMERDDALEFFSKIGEKYKIELINKIPAEEKISVYIQGNFQDLCRGPHSPSTGKVKHFKLLKVSGAYWLGDAKNDSMQRIYGTAFATRADLDKHLTFIEEAKKRDHRKIGQAMELFHMQEEAQGQIFWHQKGWQLYRILEQYIREKLEKNGYNEVKTPLLFDKILWEKSGHWAKFKENMFAIECEGTTLALKPMNCPAHIQIFKQSIRSYKDLPLRLAEFGNCHRNESSGGLHGLMRVRGFVQDDAHIFCMEEQIQSETATFCQLLQQVYIELGFCDVEVKFSNRPEVRIGDDATWDKAESALKEAVEAAGLSYTLNIGEGAFYGPKIEFVLTDAIGRRWQCGTLQVDFMLPERLEAVYIAADGTRKHPVMLHRAILGTFERFIGILTEHYSGNFPLWLAPVQVCVATITDSAHQYASSVVETLKKNGVRVIFDSENKKIDYKVRFHMLQKVPIMWIIGKREVEELSVSIRKISDDTLFKKKLDEAISSLIFDINNRGF